MPVVVTYVGLPVSSGGAHSLGRRSRRDAYRRMQTFLRECTEPAGSAHYSFAVHDVPELPPEPRFDSGLRRRFGDYAAISEDRVGDALDFLDVIDPQPTNRYGMAPVWFTAGYEFRVLDPATGRAIPGQDPRWFRGVEYEWGVPLGSSRLRLILHNRASVAIELCIPYESERQLGRVVEWLQQHLPFSFSPKHWRAWTPTRTGGFRKRRLSVVVPRPA
jgi:hypothetical protein